MRNTNTSPSFITHLTRTAAGLAMLAAASSYAQTLSKGDQRILADLAQANMAEVEAGKVALQKSTTPEVQQFAQHMVDDHSKGLQAVQDVASSKHVTLPTAPDAMHQKLVSHLNTLSGAAFDKAYLADAGVKDHAAAHRLVVSAQSKARDADVKALAAKLQPTIDQHMQQVQPLASARGLAHDESNGNTDNPANPVNQVNQANQPAKH